MLDQVTAPFGAREKDFFLGSFFSFSLFFKVPTRFLFSVSFLGFQSSGVTN